MNYGASFCHLGKRLNFRCGNDPLVQVAAFCHLHETYKIVDEPRSQRPPCVPITSGQPSKFSSPTRPEIESPCLSHVRHRPLHIDSVVKVIIACGDTVQF